MTTRRAALPLLLLFASSAEAGRTLEEPAAIRQLAKRASKADRDALKASDLGERCAGEALRSLELSGMICRLAVHAHKSAARPPRSAADVEARLRSARDAWDAAETIATYEPLTRRPGLPAQLFEGHRLACRTVVEAYDALSSVPQTAAPALRTSVDAALGGFGRGGAATLHDAACRCTQRSLELGSAAGVSLAELGALQGTLTGRSCFLDRDKVKSQRKGPDTSFSGAARAIAAENTPEARLLAYAKTRDLDLARCREKEMPLGVVKEKDRLERCVCGVVGRWKFPKERGRPELDLLVPVVDGKLGVRVKVQANGKVAGCGPLEGALLR